MGKITWLKPGEEPVVEEASGPPSLKQMQDFVEGYIELVHILGPNDTREQMIVNEEGHLVGLPFNKQATEHYHRNPTKRGMPTPYPTIVGNAIVLEGKDVWLD